MGSSAHGHATDQKLDAALIWGAALLSARSEGLAHVVLLGALATLLWLLAARLLHQYDPDNGRSFRGDMALTLVLLVLVLVPLLAIGAALVRPSTTSAFSALLAPAVLLGRMGIVGRSQRARPVDSVLVVGTGPLARLTSKDVVEGGRAVLGHLRLEDELPDVHLRAPVMGVTCDLEEVLKEHVVDEVYFAATGASHVDGVQAAIVVCERFGVPFALPICNYRLTRAAPAHEDDGYAHFLSVPRKPVQAALKRFFDIAASGIALFLLSPLLVGTAVAVKVTSRGPILFRQQRVGLHGRTFDMLKFRSMVADAEALKQRLMSQNEQSGPVFKIKRDPRITSIGRIIRKFSIDELPQLVNVLRGDMSIVGPRPPLPSEVRKYEAWQRRRLSVRPGLTCVWQVSGRNEIGFRDWMLLDMRYIDHWSLLQDFALILRTVPVVLTGRGAS